LPRGVGRLRCDIGRVKGYTDTAQLWRHGAKPSEVFTHVRERALAESHLQLDVAGGADACAPRRLRTLPPSCHTWRAAVIRRGQQGAKSELVLLSPGHAERYEGSGRLEGVARAAGAARRPG
jgi:hypothetical protein